MTKNNRWLTAERLSHYLLVGLLLTLPLERIPALHPHMFGSEISIRISQVLGVLLIVLNLPLLWKRRRTLIQPPWRWLSAFVFVTILSAGVALSLKRGLLVAAYILFVTLLAWTVAQCVSLEKLRQYRFFLLFAAVLACLFGFFQYFGNLAGLGNNITGLLPRYTKEVFGFPRIQSTGYEPLYFGDYLMIPALLAATVIVWRKKSSWLLVILFAATFSLTLSRGVYLGIGIACLLLFLLALKERRFGGAAKFVAASVAGVVVAIVMIALAPYLDRQPSPVQTGSEAIAAFTSQSVNTNSGNSIEDRSATRDTSIKAFKTHPILGIGPGNFGAYAHQTWPAYFSNNDSVSNNEPLEILAEEGGLGAAVFGLFLLSTTLWLWRRRPAADKEAGLWYRALILALVAIAIQYQTFSTLYITHVWVAVGLLIGITAAAKEAASAKQ